MPNTEPLQADAVPTPLHALREGALLGRLQGRRLLVLLDYDGTLCPIAPRPEDAVLAPTMRETLARLAERHLLGVISGRALVDVQARVGVAEAYYSGNHGLETEGPPDSGLRSQVGGEYRAALETVAERLQAQLAEVAEVAEVAGVLLEDKRYSLSLHYRQVAPGEAARVAAAVETALVGVEGLRLGAGKKVYEIRPDIDWHKGKAARWLVERIGGEGVVPLFIGDDTTDEDAFRELAADGYGILVASAPRPTAAGYWLRDVGEVRQLLDAL